MDLQLYFAVLKRYKRLVIVGTVLGIVLAVLSYGTPAFVNGKPALVARGAEVWQGQAEVLLSQAGDPYGRAAEQYSSGSKSTPPEPIADTSYLAGLSAIYAALANGDQVQSQIKHEAGVPGKVLAAEVDDVNIGTPLPLVTLTSSAPTAAAAAKLADTAAAVLENTISEQQAAAGTDPTQRVDLDVVKNGSPATLFQGHKTSVPILVLFAFLAGTVALAFILNNNNAKPIRSTRKRAGEEVSNGHGHGNGNVELPHSLAPLHPRRDVRAGLPHYD